MFLRVFYAIMIFSALSLSNYLSIASTFMLFLYVCARLLRFLHFLGASSPQSLQPCIILFCICGYKPECVICHNLHLLKSTLQLLLFFLRESYAKLLRVVKWIDFV